MEWNEREKLSELELDDVLREWKISDLPPDFRLAASPAHRVYSAWLIPCVAACLLAAIVAGVVRHAAAPEIKQPAVGRAEALWESFEPIPYTFPLGENEGAAVVRMKIPVAALLAAGFRMPAADPTAVIAADVLVGADGRPHGIRMLSAIVQEGER